jgi:hypothetical protein
MSNISKFPVEPRVGWISPEGEFLGFSVSFGAPSRAAYVVFKDNRWQEVLPPSSDKPAQ